MKLDYETAAGATVPNHPFGRGRVSFVIALVVLIVSPCVIFWAALNWGRTGPSNRVEAILIGWLIVGPLLALTGLCLGISCVIDRRRRSGFALVGLILNGIIVGLALSGLAMAVIG